MNSDAILSLPVHDPGCAIHLEADFRRWDYYTQLQSFLDWRYALRSRLYESDSIYVNRSALGLGNLEIPGLMLMEFPDRFPLALSVSWRQRLWTEDCYFDDDPYTTAETKQKTAQESLEDWFFIMSIHLQGFPASQGQEIPQVGVVFPTHANLFTLASLRTDFRPDRAARGMMEFPLADPGRLKLQGPNYTILVEPLENALAREGVLQTGRGSLGRPGTWKEISLEPHSDKDVLADPRLLY